MERGACDVAQLPVSTGYARAFLRSFAGTAQERAGLLDGTGVHEASIDAPGGVMPVAALMALAANITRTHGELWPLAAAAVWSNALQGALDVATRTAPSVSGSMATGACHGSTFAPFIRSRLQTTDDALRLTFEPTLPMAGPVWRAIALAVALNCNALYAQILEPQSGQAAFEFPWPAPAEIARLRAYFACDLKFDAPDFAFVVPLALRDRPSPFADPDLHAKAVAALETARLRAVGQTSVVDAVRALAEARLPQRLSEAEAARALGCSRRTLQRRLGLAGAAYRPLLDEVLRARAKAMLDGRALSRDDMAAALGYSDSTSFSRACRRWFGRPVDTQSSVRA